MRLFKYLIADRKDLLQNQNIRFTQSKHLNDAFELLPHVSGPANFDSFLKDDIFPILASDDESDVKNQTLSEIKTIIPHFNQQDLTNLFKGIDLHEVMDFLKPISTQLENEFSIGRQLRARWDRQFGVLSLTTRIDNPDMWSRYAGDYTGFAIELDAANSLLYNFESNHEFFRFPRNVEYLEERPSFPVMNLNNISSEVNPLLDVNNMITKTFFSKSKEWEHEKEVRVIKLLKDATKKFKSNGQDIHLFEFDSKLILNIYLGHKCSKKFQNQVVSICSEERYSHITVYKQEMLEKTYGFGYKEIKLGKMQETIAPLTVLPNPPSLFTAINLDCRNGGLVIGISKNRGGIQVYQFDKNENLSHAGDMENFQFIVNSFASLKYNEKLVKMNGEMEKIRKRHSINSLFLKLTSSRESLNVIYAIDERYKGCVTSMNISVEQNQFVMNKYSSLFYFDELTKLNDVRSEMMSFE